MGIGTRDNYMLASRIGGKEDGTVHKTSISL